MRWMLRTPREMPHGYYVGLDRVRDAPLWLRMLDASPWHVTGRTTVALLDRGLACLHVMEAAPEAALGPVPSGWRIEPHPGPQLLFVFTAPKGRIGRIRGRITFWLRRWL